jgi:thiamine transport system ATP-binding protein
MSGRERGLRVEGLTVRYGGTVAVDGVDVAVEAGEVVALLGPSGCGKSSVLRAVAGLEPAAAGRIVLDGVDVTAVAVHRRGVGLLFQDYALFPHRDVAANVGFGLKVRGVSRPATAARVAEVLELVGLVGFGRRAVGSLSGGEQQRVALARALAPEPAVLCLDEPFGALDRALRDRLAAEVPALARRLGVAIVHVTHDQEEALAVADRVVVLRAGRVAQQGTPTEVWAAPADAWVARFLGEPNLVTVTVGPSGGVTTPWGPLGGVPVGGRSVPPGPATLLVRPEALRRGPGPVDGTVAAVAFRGDHLAVRIATTARVELQARLPVGAPPDVGERWTAAIDPAATVLLASEGDAPGAAGPADRGSVRTALGVEVTR